MNRKGNFASEDMLEIIKVIIIIIVGYIIIKSLLTAV